MVENWPALLVSLVLMLAPVIWLVLWIRTQRRRRSLDQTRIAAIEQTIAGMAKGEELAL